MKEGNKSHIFTTLPCVCATIDTKRAVCIHSHTSTSEPIYKQLFSCAAKMNAHWTFIGSGCHVYRQWSHVIIYPAFLLECPQRLSGWPKPGSKVNLSPKSAHYESGFINHTLSQIKDTVQLYGAGCIVPGDQGYHGSELHIVTDAGFS